MEISMTVLYSRQGWGQSLMGNFEGGQIVAVFHRMTDPLSWEASGAERLIWFIPRTEVVVALNTELETAEEVMPRLQLLWITLLPHILIAFGVEWGMIRILFEFSNRWLHLDSEGRHAGSAAVVWHIWYLAQRALIVWLTEKTKMGKLMILNRA